MGRATNWAQLVALCATPSDPAVWVILELTNAFFPLPLRPVWMAPFLQVLFGDLICQKQSCVRPVGATHMAAGPDGFHQPIPIPHIEQQAFRTKLGVYWFLG